jgi:hypothetical protein
MSQYTSPEFKLPRTTPEVRSDNGERKTAADQLISQTKDTRRIAQTVTNKSIYSINNLTPDVAATLGANGARPTSAFSIDTNGKMNIWNSSLIGETTATVGIQAKENNIVPTIQLVRPIGANFSVYTNFSGPNLNNSILGFGGKVNVDKDTTIGGFFEPGISGQGNFGRVVFGHNH